MTTELHPDFNVFEVAKPYARDLMMHRYTPHRMLRRASKETRALAQVIRETPYQWHDVLEQARHGQLELVFRHKGLDELAHKLDVVFNRLVIALVVAGGLIGSSLIGIFAKNGPHVMGLHVISFARVPAFGDTRRVADDRRGEVGAAVSAFGDLGETKPHLIWEGVTGRVVAGERTTFVVLELDPGTVVPEHAHDNEQIGVLASGSMRFRIGDEERELRPGETWNIPSNVPHSVTAGPEGAVAIEIFTPTRADWDSLERGEPSAPRWP